MQIDDKTIEVLKNFSTINPSILIKEGNVLETISSAKTVLAFAKVPTKFPKRFAIYNLAKLIGALSIFEKPLIEFDEKTLVISEGKQKTILTYSDEDTIIKVPEKTIKLPSVDVSVQLKDVTFKTVMKQLGILGLPEIVISGDGEKVYIMAVDTKNSTSDVGSIEIGETDKTFKAVFRVENLKLLPGDYTVEISEKKLSRFYNTDVEYFIAVENGSTFSK